MKTNNLIIGIIIMFGVACGSAELNQVQYKNKIQNLVSRSTSTLSEASQEYRTLSDELSSFVMFTSTELEEKYEDLQDEYEVAEEYHEDIQYYIREVDERFSELSQNWRKRLNLYDNTDLRAQSLSNLQQTQRQYQNYYQAMQNTELQMEQILNDYNNLLLFIGQNLNRTSLSNIESDANNLRQNTSSLERQIDQTIQEANDFIQVLQNNQVYRAY